ncbi:MAG: DEAD/DEAH box helicase family protein [Oscillospiraceae bacterium]|nr:DEAD/DEAH box helicase family protein [Oscillospiraceae bacterium]
MGELELDKRWQTEAYEKAKSDFQKGNHSCIVAPTGCGKTPIGLKTIEENLDKEIIWVAPNPAAIGETRKLIKQIYGEEAKRIFPRLKFFTYNALSKMAEVDFNRLTPEIIVYDEIHRAGALTWGVRAKGLVEKTKAKVLGLTATPVRTDGRNIAEEICGGIAYELKLTEAVARGIIPVPIYISTNYLFKEDMERVENKISAIEDETERKKYEEQVEKFKRNLHVAEGMQEIFKKHMGEKDGKWIVFCKDINHMDEVEKLCGDWFDAINPNKDIIKISSGNEREENAQAIKFLRERTKEKMKLALCVNMLNESFHDEELSGLIMARPTKSEILYRQQLGRGLNRDAKQIPVVFDLVNNIKYFQKFRREIREIIQRGIAEGKRDLYNKEILEQFEIYSEQINFISEFEDIEKNLDEYLKGETTVAKALRICGILYEAGVDLTKVQMSYVLKGGERRYTTLKDIKGANEIIARTGLTEDTPVGEMMKKVRAAYNGTNVFLITEEEKELAKSLRINS